MGAEALSAALSSLGFGVLLGWALLPLLAALARRNRDAAPAAYHRALAFALLAAPLLAAPLLALTPAAKLVLGSLLLHMGTGGTAPVVDPGPVLFAWAEPSLVASRAAFVPFGQVLDAVGSLWLGVFALGVLQLTWARMRLRRRLRAAVPAPEAVRGQALEVAQRLGVRPPAIRVSPEFATPFATGFLAPVVGLDPHSCTLGPVELGYALEHELLHIARGDTRLGLAEGRYVFHSFDTGQAPFDQLRVRKVSIAGVPLAREGLVICPIDEAVFQLRVLRGGVASPLIDGVVVQA